MFKLANTMGKIMKHFSFNFSLETAEKSTIDRLQDMPVIVESERMQENTHQ